MAELKAIKLKYGNVQDVIAGKNLVVLPDALSDPRLDGLSDAALTDTPSNLSGFALSKSTPTSQQVKSFFAMNAAAQSATDPLTDEIAGNIDLQYYGPVGFGNETHPQQLSVIIDTGSADLWIPVGCGDCVNRQYEANASSTYTDTGNSFNVTYGSGNVGGTLAHDTIGVGSLKIDKQYFGAVTHVSSDFNDDPISGLIGLSFSSIAASGEPTFFENLIMQDKVSAPFFSVYLTRGKANGSTITLGGFDVSKAEGPLTWVPVISKTYWTVQFDGAVVEGKNVTGDLHAAIDTGTTLIYLSQAVASSIYANIPGAGPAANYDSNFFSFPCNSSPTISLLLGGHDFGLDLQDFNLGQEADGSKNCIGGIVGMDDAFMEGFAIIGDEFLKSWYSVYDYSHGARVGFAPNINNAQ
ncbi:acid protease [Suillus fuscotomentosus]|uniref:Acid protease n=1 Tax=Suillus fuscotomentosus TaxID=1912939 RepID=A0AAD4HNF8_9AGAM|nr:acid protease [Suillus fuscotomentosus]KAG1904185.1 acid protease [Suillus fuscotomentosus]